MINSMQRVRCITNMWKEAVMWRLDRPMKKLSVYAVCGGIFGAKLLEK